AILEDPPPPARPRGRRIARDLEVVMRTALERDVSRRYRTALEFADDLRRVRMREPIRARPVGTGIRAVRFVQRNPVVTTLVAALFLALAAGMLWSMHKGRELAAAFDEVQWLADAKRIDTLRDALLHVPARDENDVPDLVLWLDEA